MAYNKGLHSNSGGSHRGRPYVLILLITFGVALLGVMVLHKLRERRIYNLLVKEKDHQLHTLQFLLQKERDRNKELRGKNEEMKGKIYALRSQKMELARTVVEMQSTVDSLKDERKLMESALEEKQNELRVMQQKGSNVEQEGSEIIALRENLKHKEAEIKDLKRRLEIPVRNHLVSSNDHPTNFPEIVTGNGTMEARDKTKNENKDDENSGESAKSEGDDKRVTNEDASKSKVAAEIKDEFRNDEELGKAKEDPQDDGGAKDIEAEVVDGRERKAIREEVAQLENNSDGGGQDINVKQLAGVKRKHGHASRTKGKRWRTVVKNKLMVNNGNFESHGGVNMGNRKVYRNEKDELKDRRVGKVSDELKFARKNIKKEDDNPRKDNPQAKLEKPENHENIEDANNMTEKNTNHQETNNRINIHPEKQRQDEKRWSEEHEDTPVQQNWSTRHINKADKNVEQTKSNIADKNAQQTKSNMFHEENEESEVLDAQKQEKEAIDVGDDNNDNDDDVKEFQSEFEDEKEEYKEEIDESRFQSGL